MRRYDLGFFFVLVCLTGATGLVIWMASDGMMAPAILGMLLLNIMVVAWAVLKDVTDAWNEPTDPRWEHRG